MDEKQENREGTVGGPELYPDTVSKLSENWRQLSEGQQLSSPVDPEVFGGESERPGMLGPGMLDKLRRHYLPIGIGVGLLLVALLTVLGGLVFLIWNAGR